MKTKPPHKPDDESRKIVEQMAAVGIPQDGIARVIGIDPKTLRKYYEEEITTASIKANAKIGGTLYNKAINGDTSAAIWWSKARMRWSEKTETELSGELDQRVNVEIKFE
jgi:hypothetical protein|tara:strand:- start:653 stop:982 length:330 start_codon:yes stop_codon:yes gene_type:complete